MTTATEILKALADASNDQTLDLTFLKILKIEGSLDDIVKVLNRIRALRLGPRVEALSLSGNRLTHLPKKIFQGLTGLQRLWLNDNKLSGLPKGLFQGLTALQFIALIDNELSDLPEGLFQGLTVLRELYLYKNKLGTLPAGLFQGLTALRLISLDENELSDLPEGLFQGLTVLQELDLYKNKLSTLPARLFQGLTKLRLLSLKSNQLSDLPEGLFQGLTELMCLSLKSNQLSSFPENLFQGLTALQNLEIEYNHLGVFPLELLEGLALAPRHPLLEGNFNFGPEGEIQTPAGIAMPSVGVVFPRIMAEHYDNLDVLDRALGNAYPGLTFSDEQIKTLDEARTRALEALEKQRIMLFQCLYVERIPPEIGDLISSMTGYHLPKP